MKSIKENVLLISAIPYRESDIIVNMLSAASGRLSAVIYRGRLMGKTSSFPYHPGDLIEIEYRQLETRDFVKLLHSSPIELIRPDSYSYQRFVYHSYLLDIIGKISHPSYPADDLFELVIQNNRFNWQTAKTPFTIIAWTLWHLIKTGGYAIDYRLCSVCGRNTLKFGEKNEVVIRKENYQLLSSVGRLICTKCIDYPQSTQNLSPAIIKLLWLIDTSDSASDLPDNVPLNVTLSLIDILNPYLLEHYDIRLKSLPFFQSIINQQSTDSD